MKQVTNLTINGVTTKNAENINGIISEYNQRLDAIKSVFNAVIDGVRIVDYKTGAEPYMNREDLENGPNYCEIREWAGLELTGLIDVDTRVDNMIDAVCKAIATGLYGVNK